MLPTNVVSFMKKMVASDGTAYPGGSAGKSDPPEGGTALSKLRQTLATGIQGTVTKLSSSNRSSNNTEGIQVPGFLNLHGAVSSEERSLLQKVWDKNEQYDPNDYRSFKAPLISTPTAPSVGAIASSINSSSNRYSGEGSSMEEKRTLRQQRSLGSTCRVCVKVLKESEFFRKCTQCEQKVCEDCASYSSGPDEGDQSKWHCSICRRRMSSRPKIEVPPDIQQSALLAAISDSLPPPSPGGPAALSLVSGLASMASSLAAGPKSGSGESQKLTRRRSDNDEERNHQVLPAKPRLSDYMLHDTGNNSLLKLETDINRNRRPSASAKLTSDNGTDSSGEETPDSAKRGGRRRSIVRQQSYEEDLEHPLFPVGGELPVRRHSSQVPLRREEFLESKKARDSLDVPQGRVHRHHSWDYDVNRDVNLLTGTLNAAKLSSESDVSTEGGSEKGSTGALSDENAVPRRLSRSSIKRRTSYRASKETRDGAADDTTAAVETSSPPENAPDSTSDSSHHSQGAQNKAATSSSLEEDTWLYPSENDWRARRRSSAMSDGGRILPTPPHSPRMAGYSSFPSGSSGTSSTRVSQSLESNASLTDDMMRKQSSVTEGEAIKIVIHDVDKDHDRCGKGKSAESAIRKITISKDAENSSSRTRGFGMRVVGGKVGPDGRLFAYVAWTVPGGPADTAGVRKGDKILQWNGVELVDRSFEEVCQIMERAEIGSVEIVLQFCEDALNLDYGEEMSNVNTTTQKTTSTLDARASLDNENDVSSSMTRRKLPRIPGDLCRVPVSGKIQLQLWYDATNFSLIATLISAHDLRPREYGPPEAFVCVRLYPFNDTQTHSTGVAEPTCKPLWNASFIWENVSTDSIMGLTLEVSVWDYMNEGENSFLGECLIDLRHAYLDERPAWFRLHERRSRSANTTPRGSIASYDFVAPTIRRPSSVRSGSDDIDVDDSRNSSLDSGLLHPDLAWRDSRASSRRGSSLSEQVECEVYQLPRSYPHSLPQSRRSSFAVQSASPELRAEDLEARLSVSPNYYERKRTRSFRLTSRSELLLLQRDTSGEDMQYYSRPRVSSVSGINLTRSYSLKGDQQQVNKGQVSSGHRGTDEDQRNWRDQNGSTQARRALGPGQVLPKWYKDILTDDFTLGEILVQVTLTKGHLEVVVSHARGLPMAATGHPPDTYVKTYLKDGEKRLQKRKTRTAKHSCEPQFHQTLRYLAHDAVGKSLLVMVWEKPKGFESNQALGVAEISLSKLEAKKLVSGWYRLLPITSIERTESDSGESGHLN